MSDPAPLEVRFEAAMYDAYEAWKREVGYKATRFHQMLPRHGGVETARRLLRQPGMSAGFERLLDEGRLDLTMEFLVLRPDFGTLFTAQERAQARRRLVENGMRRDQLPREPY